MTDLAGIYDADARGDDLRCVVDRMCANPMVPARGVAGADIGDVVKRHWARHDDFTHLVIMLATFATAWRLFLYESPRTLAAVASTG